MVRRLDIHVFAQPISRVLQDMHRADRDGDGFPDGLGGRTAQPLLTTVLENKRYGLSQMIAGFIPGFALAVGSGNFGTVGDMPFSVLLDHRRELVSHCGSLPAFLAADQH